MDESHLAAWTRRRFGLATSGLLAALLELGIRKEVTAKHKRHHQRARTCPAGEMTCDKPRCVAGTCCPGRACGGSCFCRLVGRRTSACLQAINVDCEQDITSTCTADADCGEGTRCATIECPLTIFKRCLPLCDTTPT
jgi:hypothetical protein